MLGAGRRQGACRGLLFWEESAIAASELTLTLEPTLLSGPTPTGGFWELGGSNGTSPSTTAEVAPKEQDPEKELGG